MKKRNESVSGLRFASLLGVLALLAACGGSGGSSVVANDSLLNVSSTGSTSVNYNLWYLIDTLPYEPLNTAELDALTLMREEEKLARDVYMSLYDIWGVNIFTNISDSEQTHTDAVLRLLQKYDLADPAQDRLRGVFFNPALQGLYDTLIALGSASLLDAYFVGATIEDLDIYDLRTLSVEIDNQDITAVFDSLELGSRNHMRAFSARLDDLGAVYVPVYISQEEYDAIINSPRETG